MNAMRNFLLSVLLLAGCVSHSQAFELRLDSLRFTLSEPQTVHSLVYRGANGAGSKINFLLEPKNNERFGVFAEINGIEVGYAIDPIENDQETETQDLIFSYKKFRHSRFNLNYQTLENFQTEAENLVGPGRESRFIEKSKSTKLELFGIHNLYTFNGKSLFDHFFLNKPELSDHYSLSTSLLGSWTYQRLKLENPTQVVFTPSFVNTEVTQITDLKAQSLNASLGLMLSINLKHNFHGFLEGRFGRGYFENTDSIEQLKRSGNEDIHSIGGGISWTSARKNNLLVLRAWRQEGRHVETVFGDLSLIHFF